MRYNTLEPIINYCNVFCVRGENGHVSASPVGEKAFWPSEVKLGVCRLEKKGNNMVNSFTSAAIISDLAERWHSGARKNGSLILPNLANGN